MRVNIAECVVAGVDPKKVNSIARRLSSAGNEAKSLGLTIFGGAGHGSLRIHDNPQDTRGRALLVAELDGRYDGGDGGADVDESGLLRGE